MSSVSSDNAVDIINRLVASASCKLCAHYYDQPQIAPCGHRLCLPCWKTKKRCLTCDKEVDFNYLQKDEYMIKLAAAVRNNLRKFQNLPNYKDVCKKLPVGEGWSNKENVHRLSSSESSFVVPPTHNMTSAVPVSGLKQKANQIVIKTVQQDDFDKIECIEESQPYIAKGKQNIIEFNTDDFLIENTEESLPLRRSSRAKLMQESVKPKQTSNKVLTEAVIESKDDSVKTCTPTNDIKATISKSSSKPSNWKNVKKMKKEFSKLNKRDVKKLNVSIEMCKKTQNVISKQNVCTESVMNTELPITIEDNTPRMESVAEMSLNSCSVIISSLPEVILNENSKTLNERKACNLNNDRSAISQQKAAESNENVSGECIEKRQSPTSEVATVDNGLISHSQVLTSLHTAAPNSVKNITASIQQTSRSIVSHSNKTRDHDIRNTAVNDHTVRRKIAIRPTATVHPNKKSKSLNRVSSSDRFKSYRYRSRFARKASILNITTPEGSFIITGENICIIKKIAPSAEKSVQTEMEIINPCNKKSIETEFSQQNDSAFKPVINEVAEIGTTNVVPSLLNVVETSTTSCIQSDDKSTTYASTGTQPVNNTGKSRKPTTASADTATGPFKITESVEKELINEMEVVEDTDIFNTQNSGARTECISRDIFHTEFVGDRSQKSQRSKRQREMNEEPLRKKAKSNTQTMLPQSNDLNCSETINNIVPHSQNKSQDHSKSSKETNNKIPDTLTHEFDEITSNVFAQIDVDLIEHNNKNKVSQVNNNEQENCASDTEDNENVLDLNTPKSNRNNTINIDSDSSFVEETPQKDKSSSKQSSKSNTTVIAAKANNDDPSPKQNEINVADLNNVQSPFALTFLRGITDESTPVRTAPRRSLNFSKVHANSQKDFEGLNPDSLSLLETSDSADVAKTTLEKEFMEKAFEKTPHTVPTRKQISLRKEVVRESRHIQIACSCLSQEEKMEIIRLAKKHKWEFVESYTPKVTHLIVGVDDKKAQRTEKYIYALAAGKWILSFDWISDCIKNNKILDEAPYEVLDMTGYNGPMLSRTAKTKLFEGILFYCQPPFNTLERKALEIILESAGGKIAKKIEEVSLKSTSSVAIVIAEPQSTLDQEYTCLAIDKSVVPVNYEWAFNCLGSYTLQPLLLLCPSSLIPVDKLNWPRCLFDQNDSNDEIETQ